MQDPLFEMRNDYGPKNYHEFDYSNQMVNGNECLDCQNKSYIGGEINMNPSLKKKMNY